MRDGGQMARPSLTCRHSRMAGGRVGGGPKPLIADFRDRGRGFNALPVGEPRFTMVHMRLTTFIALSVAVFFGCHRSERSADKATDTTATDTAAKKTGDVTLTEEELARFLAWMRADVALSDRIEEDTRTMTQEVADRVQPGEDASRAPQYIAMLERHRSELQADKEAMPLDEERARALTQPIPGIVGDPPEITHPPAPAQAPTPQ